MQLRTEYSDHMERNSLGAKWSPGTDGPFQPPAGYELQGAISKDSTTSSFVQDMVPPPPSADVEWTLEGYLKRVNIDHFSVAVAEYKRSARRHQSRPQIRRALFNVLRAPGVANVVLPFRAYQVPAGVELYRARTITEPSQIKTEDDIWMAPPSYIGAGRLNNIGEPLLYTATNGATALFEVRAKPGDLVAVSRFRVVKPFLSMALSARIDEPELSFLSQRKLGLITRFIEDVFTQEIGSDESHRYMAPDLLAKEFLNFHTKLDGWTYRSVADPREEVLSAVNTCIRGERAKDLLAYTGTDIIEVTTLRMEGPHTRLNSLASIRGTKLLGPSICSASLSASNIPNLSAAALAARSGPGLGEVAAFLEKRQNSGAADAQFQQSLNSAPATPLAVMGLSIKEQGRVHEAEELFRSSAERGSNLGATYLGILLSERGDLGEAEKFFRLAASRRFAYGLRCLGVLLARVGRVSEAEAAYREAAAQGDIQSMSNLGASLYNRGHLRQAEPFLRRAANAGSTHAMYGLARLVFDRGRKEEAESLLIAAADKKEPEAMSWLGMSRVMTGNAEEGLNLLREAVAAGYSKAQDHLDNLNAGNASASEQPDVTEP